MLQEAEPHEAELLALAGFAKVRQSFTSDEAARLVEAVDAAAAEVRAHHEETGSRFVWMTPVTSMDPVFTELLDDERVSGLAETLLGPQCRYLGQSIAGVWDHRTPWHAETPTPGRRDLRITVCLDSFDVGEGGFAMLPGSHHDGYNQALRSAFESDLLDRHDPDVLGAEVAAPTSPGDVHVFDAALWHCGSGTAHPSRQISFWFHAWQPDMASAAAAGRVRDFVASYPRWRDGFSLYDEAFIDTVSGRRLRMIEPLVDLGFADPRRPRFTRADVIQTAYLETAMHEPSKEHHK